jgi:predicted DNA-binding protein (UPF0251 family)
LAQVKVVQRVVWKDLQRAAKKVVYMAASLVHQMAAETGQLKVFERVEASVSGRAELWVD